MKYRYIIHCQKMQREEAFIAEDMTHLFRVMQDYIMRFGPIDLLYNVGRA